MTTLLVISNEETHDKILVGKFWTRFKNSDRFVIEVQNRKVQVQAFARSRRLLKEHRHD